MGPTAPKFNVIEDYAPGSSEDIPEQISTSAFWIVAIIRLGAPLSFSRATLSSVSTDVTLGAFLRSDKPLVITDDCTQIVIQNNKNSHLKYLSATLKQSNDNYLAEILPGDWALGWMFTNDEDYRRVLKKIDAGQACNEFEDGFKFVGRVHSLRKALRIDRAIGRKTVDYSLQCIGFNELDSMLYYDPALATQDFANADIGNWLTRIGLNVDELFNEKAFNGNINVVLQNILNILIGRGVNKNINPGTSLGLRASSGAGSEPEAPFAYLVPKLVGDLLGKQSSDASKASGILAYSDILELLQGVQRYTIGMYPDLNLSRSTPNRKITETELLGAFIPAMPSFANRPIWGVLQQYVNPTVNELYTCLRINDEGKVVPTLVFRQIPFTTEAYEGDPDQALGAQEIAVTKFLSLPRWIVPSIMVHEVDIGRSDATHCNLVKIDGVAADTASNIGKTEQVAQNPPIRDDLDIQRSGVRPYVTTVDVAPQDEVGRVPRIWMSLVADWMMGSQYTLNGTLECMGIQSPICEGDNLEWDDVVFHIEGVTHRGRIDPETGMKSFATTLTMTNGMRAVTEGGVSLLKIGELPLRPDGTPDVANLEVTVAQHEFPIYAGLKQQDQRTHDPIATKEEE